MAASSWTEAELIRSCTIGKVSHAVVTCMCLTHHYVIIGLDNKTIHIFDRQGDGHRIFEGHTGAPWVLETLDDVLMSGATDKTIRLWDLESGKCLMTLQGHTSTVRGLGITQNKRVVSSSRDGTIRIWNPETGQCEQVLEGHTLTVRSIAVHNNLVASGSYDGTARLWNAFSGELLHVFGGHDDKIFKVVFDGQRIVTGSMDSSIRVWDPNNGNCLATLNGHKSLVGILRLEGDKLVSAGADGIVCIWSMNDYTMIHQIKAHDNAVVSLSCLYPVIVSGGESVKVWDIRNGQLVQEVGKNGAVVWSVAVSDGLVAIAVAREGNALLETWKIFDPPLHTGSDGTH